jgi:hypothetical protein BACCOPRO_01005
MKKTMNARLAICGLCLLGFLTACDEEWIKPTPKPDPENKVTLKVNEFIYEGLRSEYLWENTINWNAIDFKKEKDPHAFFKRLIYKDDRWTNLTDNAEAWNQGFAGISTTYGFDLRFSYIGQTEELVAIVRYVYPGTPADRAGIRRGDLLLKLNGGPITVKNYADFYDKPTIVVNKGILKDKTLTAEPVGVAMTAVEMYQDPILKDTVINKDGHRVGYLCYSDYTERSTAELIKVFTRFKTAGVTDVVLDLRYNGGGYVSTARALCSILAPEAAMKKKERFLFKLWNENYMSYWKSKGRNDELYETFVDTLGINMNLNRLYILTGKGTASASELTLTGLTPYMDVVQIGDTTHGKFCGGIVLMPKHLWWDKDASYYQEIKNWGMYVMIYKFSNKRNDEFPRGFAPKYVVKEYLLELYPFGDERDPLLGKALELITGKQVAKARSRRIQPALRELPIDNPNRPLNGKAIDTPPAGQRLFMSNK